MKSLYFCLLVFCAAIAVPGCGGGSGENTLATEGLTADDFAKYEAELAAVSGEDSYGAEDEGDDDGTTQEATTEEATAQEASAEEATAE